jgi:glycosyltransferase involved in cell wall biosynthesis
MEPLQNGSQWLFVGRIVPNKAQHDLVAAFAAYQQMYDREAKLILIGTGLAPYEKAIQELIRELGLQQSVKLLGATTEEEKRQYFLSSDIYVSLSEHEGFGIPLVEAMHYGLPVVAYEAAAVRETLGGKGLLLDSKKPTEVAAVVHEILQDDQILNSLASDGYQRAEELSFELNLEEYKRVLSPLISG